MVNETSPATTGTPETTTPSTTTIIYDTCEDIYGSGAPECASSTEAPLSPTTTPSCPENSYSTNQCLNDTICGPPYFEYKCEERCACNEGYSYKVDTDCCVATSECESEVTATSKSEGAIFLEFFVILKICREH